MDKTHYLVRKAVEQDIPRILQLLVQVNMVHHHDRPDLFKGPTVKYSKQQLTAILQDEKTPVFVCVDAKDIVQGHTFCQIRQVADDNLFVGIKTLYIDDLCVDETARGQHIGSLLYEHVKTYAKEIGCYNITLHVWSFNESARIFYEKCGLQPQKITMEEILQ